jgi:hypothetical protein
MTAGQSINGIASKNAYLLCGRSVFSSKEMTTRIGRCGKLVNFSKARQG